MMEQFLYTDGHTDRRTHGQTDTTKHYSPQTIRNGWGLKTHVHIVNLNTACEEIEACERIRVIHQTVGVSKSKSPAHWNDRDEQLSASTALM